MNSNCGNYAIPIDISIATPSVEATPIVEPTVTTMHQMPQKASVHFSFGEFWRTLGKFILYPIGFFWATIPLFIWLYNYETIFWGVVVAYVVVAFMVAIVRGDRKAKNESQIYKKQRNMVASTSSRDPFAPSTFTGTNFVIGNTFRGMYHRPSCEWARKISSGNVVKMTIEEARRRGYKRCKVCRP